jgi:fumarate hydratase class I
MTEFVFQEMFPLGEDDTPYRKLDAGGVSVGRFEGQDLLKVDPAALTTLANEAFVDISFLLRPSHLKQLRAVYDAPDASDNDRYVAFEMLKNANIAAGRVLPMCQDTGTAIIMGKKGERVLTGGADEAALSKGVFRAFTENSLRYSQMAPLDMYKEVNTKTNLPAQIEIYATKGDAYEFLFIAKGGGSANKSFLFQETRALLTPERLVKFIEAKAREIGTAACPPYHLAIVIGGTSAEFNLKTVKLATCRYLDHLPAKGGPGGHAFRDLEMEQAVLAMSRDLGIGAQFGGRYYCHDVRVIRLPRHGASMPIGIGVSCSADRQAKAKITREGLFLERLETNPAQYMPDVTDAQLGGACVNIDVNRPMAEIRRELSRHPIRTRLALSGTLVVARDIAHAKLRERLEAGQGLPDYFKNHPVYYAGPAKTPEGYASGSFGPTTAGRMDGYADQFMAAGGSHVMLAKGNRSKQVTEACKKHGGFYLGSIGGPAARLAQDCIRKVEVLDYPELGMEAVWRIEVENFPAFIVVDDKGNDFFAHVNR